MLPSEIGERTEAAVLAALTRAGKRVLLPFGEQQRFDLAYEENGRIVKVQCKTGVERKGAIWFRTHSVGRKSIRDYRADVDFFGVYCHDRNEVYLVPVQDVPARGAHLRINPARNHQQSGVRWATPYLISDDLRPALRGQHEPERPLKDRQLSILTDLDPAAKLEGVLAKTIDLPVACCAPLGGPNLDDDEAQATSDLFKALADPHRVRIINLLANADGPVCVCEITPLLGLSQPTTSFHLKKLTAAGLIEREQRGTWAYYSLKREAIKTLGGILEFKETA